MLLGEIPLALPVTEAGTPATPAPSGAGAEGFADSLAQAMGAPVPAVLTVAAAPAEAPAMPEMAVPPTEAVLAALPQMAVAAVDAPVAEAEAVPVEDVPVLADEPGAAPAVPPAVPGAEAEAKAALPDDAVAEADGADVEAEPEGVSPDPGLMIAPPNADETQAMAAALAQTVAQTAAQVEMPTTVQTGAEAAPTATLTAAAPAAAVVGAVTTRGERAVGVRLQASLALPGLAAAPRPGPQAAPAPAPAPEADEGTEAKPVKRAAKPVALPEAGVPRAEPVQAAVSPRVESRPQDAAKDAPVPAIRGAADGAMTAPVVAQALPQADPRMTAPLRTDLPGWEQALTERIKADLSQDGKDIELHLSPEKLGPLKIRLEMADGQAQVKFVTATPEAARVFAEAQHRLSESLSRAGIDLGGQTTTSGEGRDDRPAPRGRTPEFLTRPAQGTPGQMAGPRAGSGLVNLMA